VLGSVERMFAILTEHYAGKWPFFLSPRQVMVVPVTKAYADYAQSVCARIKQVQHSLPLRRTRSTPCHSADSATLPASPAGYYAEVDVSARTLNKMVREAQLSQFNYILVVGGEEEKANTASVRTRDNAQHGSKSIDDLIAEFGQMTDDHTLDLQLGVVTEEDAKQLSGKKK